MWYETSALGLSRMRRTGPLSLSLSLSLARGALATLARGALARGALARGSRSFGSSPMAALWPLARPLVPEEPASQGNGASQPASQPASQGRGEASQPRREPIIMCIII